MRKPHQEKFDQALDELSKCETDEERILKITHMKSLLKQNFRKHNSAVGQQCGINKPRMPEVHPGPVNELIYKDHGRKCYVCKKKFEDVHPFYHCMCIDCGDFNFDKRSQVTDLTGKLAIVTGGRIKIGFQTCLKLLRMDATVIATTRFPTDALERYQKEPDYSQFKDRLTIWPLDLLDAAAIDEFIDYVCRDYQRLDILINNAAQTIDRPVEYYQREMLGESIFTKDFPDLVDENGIQVDYRSRNTWVQRLDKTGNSELIATTVVNYMAPFALLRGLKKLMVGTVDDPCFVINVSSMEGKFTTRKGMKTDRHVHNNAMKAALNMITRSISYKWQQDHILVNSVETGWITDEFPKEKKDTYEVPFLPPLDEVDGASRILDPIIDCTATNRTVGLFLKDYYRTGW